jgi:hypothetical protein
MDRNAMNSQIALFDKADELGIRQQLSGYSQMTPEQRRAVSPQVSRLAEALGAYPITVKRFMLPPYSVFDTLEYREEQAANAERAYAPHGAYGAYPRPAVAASAEGAYAPHDAYGAYPRPAVAGNRILQRVEAQKDICKLYIAKLKRVREELERVKEENTRLEKENATLIELLPGRGRGGSRKRTIRRKRH